MLTASPSRMDHLTVSHNYPSINECIIIGTRQTALGKGEDGEDGRGKKKKNGGVRLIVNSFMTDKQSNRSIGV